MKESLHNHLLRRGCNPENYHVHLDEATRTATFMLSAPGTGKIVGYHTYKPEGKKTSEGKGYNPKELRYFTKHLGTGEEPLFFGGDKLDFGKRKLYLVEGIFDAVKFHTLGLNCIAVLGNNPKPLKEWLQASSFFVTGVLDDDAAGKALAKFCNRYYICDEGKDPGDMTVGELSNFLYFHEFYIDGQEGV